MRIQTRRSFGVSCSCLPRTPTGRSRQLVLASPSRPARSHDISVATRNVPSSPSARSSCVTVGVLLARRGKEPSYGLWSLPGGAVDLGEGLKACGGAGDPGGMRDRGRDSRTCWRWWSAMVARSRRPGPVSLCHRGLPGTVDERGACLLSGGAGGPLGPAGGFSAVRDDPRHGGGRPADAGDGKESRGAVTETGTGTETGTASAAGTREREAQGSRGRLRSRGRNGDRESGGSRTLSALTADADCR
ncbi:MAG: hypothetical protein MZV70_04995 [Desulfobacterales bacterium]|nr:hypothetical protein [Desulfobacterales bacterium]